MSNLDYSNIDALFDSIMKKDDNTEIIKQRNIDIDTSNINNTSTAIKNEPDDNTSSLQPSFKETSIVDKIRQIEIELNEIFIEREKIIHLMLITMVSNANMLMIGPPGTGKSKLVEELCSRITNSSYFQWLLNKTTDPSELFGSYSIKGMENDEFKRITTGKLSESTIAFLDEIWKSNSPTLNMLLPIMNERIFYNNGKKERIPLISLYGASNELPDDETLDALYDRFLIRVNTEYISDINNKKTMYRNYIRERSNIIINKPKTTITIDEIKIIRDKATKVDISNEIITCYAKLMNTLKNELKIVISDRRQNECLKILQANAVLNNRNQVIIDDLRELTNSLWIKNINDVIDIETVIEDIINPYDKRFRTMIRDYAKIKGEIDEINDTQEKTKKIIESRAILNRLAYKVNKLIKDAMKVGKNVDEYAKFSDALSKEINLMLTNALGLIGGGTVQDDRRE